MLKNIHFVLSHTSHPGNIGAAARALKTMGLEQLILIKPKKFPHVDATTLAAGADDILNSAKVTDSLDDALAKYQLIIGTSARDRSLAWSLLNPKQAAEMVIAEAKNNHQVAILFGREDSGLLNEELQKCHYHLQIPANPEYSSLNIAASIQVIAYEIRMRSLADNLVNPEMTSHFASAEQIESFYAHLEKVLYEIEFIRPGHPNRIMQRLRRLYQRTRLEKVELDILRGILTEIEKLKERGSKVGDV